MLTQQTGRVLQSFWILSGRQLADICATAGQFQSLLRKNGVKPVEQMANSRNPSEPHEEAETYCRIESPKNLNSGHPVAIRKATVHLGHELIH